MMKRQHLETRSRLRGIELRGRRLECNLVLAPMAGVTNLPFRLIARQAGAALVFTETVSAKGLASRGAKSWRLVDHSPHEGPLAYQLFGSEPAVLAEATRMLVDRGAEFIDLNLGCPAKKFIRKGAGCALMREPAAVAPLVAAMRRSIPSGVLSLKMRLGWSTESITAPEVAKLAEAEGADFVSVHGRTRAQFYRGEVDRQRIAEVVEAVAIPVLANGDIVRAEDALSMLHDTGAAGIMIGRGALMNPWIFSQVVELAEGRPVPQPSARERLELVRHHIGIMLDYFPDRRGAIHMLKKYLSAYSTGLPGASEFRNRINRSHDLEVMIENVEGFFLEAA